MVDASHGNSGKDFREVREVVKDLAGRIESGDRSVFGIMIESFLRKVGKTFWLGHLPRTYPKQLVYGKSVTDACLGWEEPSGCSKSLPAGSANHRSQSELN